MNQRVGLEDDEGIPQIEPLEESGGSETDKIGGWRGRPSVRRKDRVAKKEILGGNGGGRPEIETDKGQSENDRSV